MPLVYDINVYFNVLSFAIYFLLLFSLYLHWTEIEKSYDKKRIVTKMKTYTNFFTE